MKRNPHPDLTTLFYANALRESMDFTTSAIPYRHELKAATKNFLRLYNEKVTPQLVRMYNIEGNDENFEMVNAQFAELGRTIAQCPINRLYDLICLIAAFNAGEVQIVENVAEKSEKEQ